MTLQSTFAWLLLGALGSSLIWNVQQALSASQVGDFSRAEACSSAACDAEPSLHATLALPAGFELGLSPDRIESLASMCERSCDEARDLDERAAAALSELWRQLADPEVDAERADELVARVIDLRSKSLRECVRAALEVRDSLPPESASALFEECCAQSQADDSSE